MFNSNVFKRWIATDQSRSEFASLVAKWNSKEPEKANKLVLNIIKQIKRNNDARKTLNALLAVTTGDLDLTTRMAELDALNRESNGLAGLMDCLRETLRNTNMGLAWSTLRIHYDKVLGTVRNLARLRNHLESIDGFDDYQEICEELRDELDLFYCSDCGEFEYDARGCRTWGEESVCRQCAENDYTYSDYYGEYIYASSTRNALDRNGESVIIHEDDDNFFYDDDEDTYVHHDYRPALRVLGGYHDSKRRQHPIPDDWSINRSMWLGVELECEVRNDDTDRESKAAQLNEIINQGEIGKRVFFETDGSLNYGIEIISQPMSLPMHREMWQWLNNKDAVRHMRSHNTSTCGLHVHVSRNPLSQDQIAKMVVFVNDRNNEHLIRSVARRYAEGYCRIKEKEIGSAHYSSDRYEAINITSDKTVEFRIFKGSLKYESVIAAIEFAHALTSFTGDPSIGVSDLTTDKFLDYIDNKMKDEVQTLLPYINNRLELA